MKKALFIISLFLFTFFVKDAQAKVLPQSAKAVKTTTTTKAATGISVYPYLRSDRRAVIVNFANLQNAKAVSYSLTYKTSEQEEGAMGAIVLKGPQTAFQELLFGTCSKGVCRYHSGITNAKLEISYTTISGKKYLKRFRIKV